MEAIQDFHQITKQLLDLLKQDTQDRDEQIEKVQDLLDQRDELLKSIQPPFSQAEQVLGKQVVALNQQVDDLLAKQKINIQQDIKQLSIQKETNHKYTNPYESLAVDGVFYDKRK